MKAHEIFAFVSWLKGSSLEQIRNERTLLWQRKDSPQATKQGKKDLMLSISFIEAELRMRSYFIETRGTVC